MTMETIYQLWFTVGIALCLARLIQLWVTRRRARSERDVSATLQFELRTWVEQANSRASGRRPEPHDDSMIEPRDENDPFCTCPKCELAGTHLLAPTVVAVRPLRILFSRLGAPYAVGRPGFVQMTHPDLPRQPIEVAEEAAPVHAKSGWVLRMARVVAGGPGPVLRWETRRTCVFCGHRWTTGPVPTPPAAAPLDPWSESTCKTCGAEGLWCGSAYAPPRGHEILREPSERGFRLRCPQRATHERAKDGAARTAELLAKVERADETLARLDDLICSAQARQDLIGSDEVALDPSQTAPDSCYVTAAYRCPACDAGAIELVTLDGTPPKAVRTCSCPVTQGAVADDPVDWFGWSL